jgi:hypothetical protein
MAPRRCAAWPSTPTAPSAPSRLRSPLTASSGTIRAFPPHTSPSASWARAARARKLPARRGRGAGRHAARACGYRATCRQATWCSSRGRRPTAGRTLTRNACPWGSYRRNIIEITAVEGNTITLDQPLRIEFPTIDGSYVQRFVPIRRCGLEETCTIEQTENLWITTSQFQNAWDCWARGVTVRMCRALPGLREPRQVLRDPRLRLRRRVVQGRRRDGLRRLGELLRLPDGGRGDLPLPPRPALPVGGVGERDPQQRLPRERRAVALGMDEREPLRELRDHLGARPRRLRLRDVGLAPGGYRARPQRPAQRRLQLRRDLRAREPLDGRDE